MEEEKSIRIPFGPEEARLYEMAERRCQEKGIGMADYIKSLIKVDLAWGNFARRKKSRDGKNE